MNENNSSHIAPIIDACREEANAAQEVFMARWRREAKTPQEEAMRQCRGVLKREEILIRALRREARNLHRTGDLDGFRRLNMACACPGERARCAGLALAFLRGWDLERVEPTTKGPYRHLRYLGDEIAKKAGVPLVEIDAWIRAGWEQIEAHRGEDDAQRQARWLAAKAEAYREHHLNLAASW